MVKPEFDSAGRARSSDGFRSYNAFLRRDGPTNNSFYSFGGNK